ncbi:hypothetical protein S40288_06253 [Stachybotrys chartarum IBT 40288]|nr:hypothetical protein S40288_06253 [Stachybotrys chartarum IBT 40288]
MAFSSASPASLLGLPTEILLEILQNMDLASIFRLSVVNHEFQGFFKFYKASILLPVLAHEFSPFDELLQVHSASADDIAAFGGRYVPRKIIFKRFPGDNGLVLAPPSTPLPAASQTPDASFNQTFRAKKQTVSVAPAARPVVLTERDFKSILAQCQLVRKWEERFPQMRWYQEPENCRSLRPNERFRFRRALYRWWLYGIYFHGEMRRPRIGLPEPLVDDIRTSQMRRHSTSELLELMDLVETMKDVVLHYICPRLDPNHLTCIDEEPLIEHAGRGQSLVTSWNDQSPWGRIVKTYAKLGPAELLHYFENIYSYPRHRLLAEMHLNHPSLTLDQESIQIAIRCALDERNWLERCPSLAEDSAGGILDFDDERDEERITFGGDASADGLLPAGTTFVRSFSQYSPRGDDGGYLEERPRQSSSTYRYRTSVGWGAGM